MVAEDLVLLEVNFLDLPASQKTVTIRLLQNNNFFSLKIKKEF